LTFPSQIQKQLGIHEIGHSSCVAIKRRKPKSGIATAHTRKKHRTTQRRLGRDGKQIKFDKKYTNVIFGLVNFIIWCKINIDNSIIDLNITIEEIIKRSK
jgi:hypothetical protein